MMTPEEYQAAIQRVSELIPLDPAPDTEEGMELERLVQEITVYEEEKEAPDGQG